MPDEPAALPQMPATPRAWITVVDSDQGPSSHIGWERLRGSNHHPLFTADQLRAYGLACRAAALEEAARECERCGPSSGSFKLVSDGFAAAIRALKEQG